MGTTDQGKQLLSFAYGQEARSIIFNRINYKLHQTGIYQGATLTRNSDIEVAISPFVAFVEDPSSLIGVKVQTTETIAIAISSATPYIVCRMDWQNQFANYAEIVAVDAAGLTSNTITLGKAIYSGATLQSFDLTVRHEIDASRFRTQNIPFNVFALEPYSNSVYVNGGVIKLYDSIVTISGQTLGPFTDTVNGRKDIIFIDTDGTLGFEEGVDSTTPVLPDYDGRIVIAEVHRGASRTTVTGSEILNINPDRIFNELPGIEWVEGSLVISALTANRIASTNADKKLVSSSAVEWVLPTSNQIDITDNGDGTATISLSDSIEIPGTMTSEQVNTNTIDTKDALLLSILKSIDVTGNIEASGSLTAGTETNTPILNSDTINNTGKVTTNDIESETGTFNSDVNINGELTAPSALMNAITALYGAPLTLNGGLTISGDLNVLGDSTIIDAETMTVKDNTIVLNQGEPGAGVTARYAGLEVDRGSLNKYAILFDEAVDEFRIGEVVIYEGTAQAGTATSITLAATVDVTDQTYFNGSYIYIKAGTGFGQLLQIAAVGNNWDNTTKVLTTPAWGVEPDDTTQYIIKTEDFTQAVATREDNPTDKTYQFWNDSENRLESGSITEEAASIDVSKDVNVTGTVDASDGFSTTNGDITTTNGSVNAPTVNSNDINNTGNIDTDTLSATTSVTSPDIITDEIAADTADRVTFLDDLEVQGGVKVADSIIEENGVFRYNTVEGRFEGYSGGTWISFEGSSTITPYIVAESITAGQIVALDSSGNLIVASKDSSTRAHAIGIAKESGTPIAPDIIDVQSTGLFENYTLSALTPGLPCYLANSGAITQDPDTDITNGDFWVKIGVAAGTDKIVLEIGEAQLLEYDTQPISSLCIMSSSDVPDGWIVAKGQELSRSTYSELNTIYAADGYPFGNGDGSTTFNLPDYNDDTILVKVRNVKRMTVVETINVDNRLSLVETDVADHETRITSNEQELVSQDGRLDFLEVDQNLLDKIKNVDGAGSGLDADTLDSWEGEDFHELSTESVQAYYPIIGVPEYPDDPAGADYFNDNFTGADGWSASNCTLSYTDGKMIVTATGANPNIYRSSIAGRTVRAKIKRVSGSATTSRIVTQGGAYEDLQTLEEGWNIHDAYTGASPGSLQLIYPGYNGSASGDVYEIEFIYIGNGNYKENSLIDATGNQNHGRIYGATPVDGISGKALSFDGVNDYCQTQILPSPDRDLTVFGYVYIPSTYSWNVGGQTFIIGGIASAQGIGIVRSSVNNTIQASIRNSDGIAASNAFTILRDTFYLCTAVYKGATTKTISLYVNGALVSESSAYGGTAAFSGPLTIGRYPQGGGSPDPYFTGIVGLVGFINAVLTPSQVKQLYRSKGRLPLNIGGEEMVTMLDNRPEFDGISGETAWHTGNTVVDGSGFIKEASPIIQLFSDGSIKEPCEKSGAIVVKKDTGVYEITGTQGLSDTGWYIEVPKDRHGATKLYVEWDQDADNKITLRTFEPVGSGWRPEKGDPTDIPEGRWVDLRFNPIPEPEPAEEAEQEQNDPI